MPTITDATVVAQAYDTVVKFVSENSDCILLSKEYNNNSTKMRFLCKCGNEFNCSYNHFKNGKRMCNDCSEKERIRKRKKTTESFKEEVKDKYGDEFLISGKYTGATNPILIKHNIDHCNHEWFASPSHFLGGRTCPECSKKRVINFNRKTHEQFVQEVFELVGDKYSVLSNYINSTTKVLMRHNECGYEWETKPHHFTHNERRCPHCKKSKGEKLIEESLKTLNLNYEPQFRMSECRDVYTLPFDFAVFDCNKNLSFLIEYDGEQHFRVVEHWGGESGLKERQYHDQIKTLYCNKNNIPLLRIPYWKRDSTLGIISDFTDYLVKGSVDIA